MKSEKGITLMSLIVYIIAMCLVMATLAVISEFFFNNKEHIVDSSRNISEYNKFNMYFIEDVKNNKSTYTVTDNEIIFEDGTSYTFIQNEDNSIYRNKVKICENIKHCKFTKINKIVDEVEKEIIEVHIVINGAQLFESTNEYVLRYW